MISIKAKGTAKIKNLTTKLEEKKALVAFISFTSIQKRKMQTSLKLYAKATDVDDKDIYPLRVRLSYTEVYQTIKRETVTPQPKEIPGQEAVAVKDREMVTDFADRIKVTEVDAEREVVINHELGIRNSFDTDGEIPSLEIAEQYWINKLTALGYVVEKL